jgi:hypothetical protein
MFCFSDLHQIIISDSPKWIAVVDTWYYRIVPNGWQFWTLDIISDCPKWMAVLDTWYYRIVPNGWQFWTRDVIRLSQMDGSFGHVMLSDCPKWMAVVDTDVIRFKWMAVVDTWYYQIVPNGWQLWTRDIIRLSKMDGSCGHVIDCPKWMTANSTQRRISTLSVCEPRSTPSSVKGGMTVVDILFYVVRYSCDVTDAILIPLLYNE